MKRPELPEDLVDEILCRVPATYLKGLRTTCQRWNHLYKDKRFARKHFDKSPKQFLYVMAMTNYSICPMSINLKPHIFSSVIVPSVQLKDEISLIDPNDSAFKFHQVIHCDGFLVFTCEDESRILVWNPLTRETRWIQPRKGLKEGFLGYCNNSKSHKILTSGLCSNDLQVYDFSSDSWRVIDDVITPGWSLSFSYQCVSVKGNAYMFAIEVDSKTEISLCLLEFDFSTEKSVHVPLPRQWHSHRSTSIFVVREEKVAVLLQRERTSETEIWVSNKIDQGTKVVSWSKILALDLSPDLIIWPDASSCLLDEEKKLLVWCTKTTDNGNTFFDKIYIVGEDNKVTIVDFGPDTVNGRWPSIHNYVPSLVRIDQAVYK